MTPPATMVSRMIFALIVVVCGCLIVLLPLAVTPGFAQGPATPVLDATDPSDPVIGEWRLRFGKIFLGTVVAVTGEDAVETSDPMDSLPVILYAVDVSRSPKGDVRGRVEIWYFDFDTLSPDVLDYGATGQ